MLVRLTLTLLTVAVIPVLSGCGQTKITSRGKFTSSNFDANKKSKVAKEALAEGGDAGKNFKACPGAQVATSLSLAGFNFTEVNGTEKTLGDSKSFCDLLTQSANSVGIFHFINPKIDTTHDQLENIQTALATSPYGKQIKHFIIASGSDDKAITDAFVTDAQGRFPDATAHRDDEEKTFNSFAKTPGNFDLPTLVTMAVSGKGLVINDQPDSYLDIVKAAEELLKGEIPSATAEKSLFDLESTLGWDGLVNLGTSSFEIVVVR